jgi:hypothetical protein
MLRSMALCCLLCMATLCVQAGEEPPTFGPCPCADSGVNHATDYNPPDWRLQLSELLRTPTVCNATQCNTELTYCPSP